MTAEDILEDAERLTRIYGKSVLRSMADMQRELGSVYVTKQNDMILSVRMKLSDAVDDASAHMQRLSGDWEVESEHRWRSVDNVFLTISIETHDLR